MVAVRPDPGPGQQAMTARPKTREELLAQLADHIGELVDPIEHAERYGVRSKTGHRRVARVHRSHHPSLLDELREAAGAVATYRPPPGLTAVGTFAPAAAANLDAVDRLIAISADLARWMSQLKIRRDDRTTKARMRALVGAAARLPHAKLARLTSDVDRWRSWCRVLGAWEDPLPHLPTVPCPQCDTFPGERAGLRIRLDRSAAVCLTCQAIWDENTVGILAEHIRICLTRQHTKPQPADEVPAPRSYGGRA